MASVHLQQQSGPCSHFFYHKYTHCDKGPPIRWLLSGYENAKTDKVPTGTWKQLSSQAWNENKQ